MMDARFAYLAVGMAVGFIVGYIVRSLREIKDKVEEVDKHVTHKDDDGFAKSDWITNVALLLVVVLVAFAAFKSQKASNDVQGQQNRSDLIVSCNQQYLVKTIAALNARTEFTQEQSAANVDLQKSQAKFLSTILSKPAPSPETSYRALSDYYQALGTFTTVAAKSSAQVDANPYPTATEFLDCVNNAKGK